MNHNTKVARSDLICDLLQIIGEARRPRYPKWRFKLDELALDLKYDTRNKRDPHIIGSLYPLEPPDNKDDRWSLRFELLVDDVDVMTWNLRQAWASSKYDYCSRARLIAMELHRDHSEAGDALRREQMQGFKLLHDQIESEAVARLVAIFDGHRLDVLDTSMMLEDRCLICGRALSDPTSRDRWIGPECWQKWACRPVARRYVVPREEGGPVQVEHSWA